MSELQNKQRISSRQLSEDKILISLYNLSQNTSQQQKTIIINNTTTIQEVKQIILNNLEQNEYNEYLELQFQKDQPFIGNLNQLVLNKIKQANTRTIYYKLVKRNNSQPLNHNNNNQQPNLVTKAQEQRVQQQQKGFFQKNLISTKQSNPQIQIAYTPNNQRDIIFYQQENQSFKNSLQQLQIQYSDLQKQSQEFNNEKILINKQILKYSLQMQNYEQDNKFLRKQNQQLSDELAKLQYNWSECQNLKIENQTIKDEINQIKIFSEQILIEKHKLQEQISQLVIEQHKFNNLQQENQRLIQIINDFKEKPNHISQNQIQKLDAKQIQFLNNFQNVEQQKNQQIQILTPKFKKNMQSNLDSQNQNFINQCGHTFSIQQLEFIVFKAYLNKQKALCNQCKKPIKQKLCLQVQSTGKMYLENQFKSDLLNLIKFIGLKNNSNSKQLAKCKNLNCNFFCIWQQKQIDQQMKQQNSFCLICQEQSVINPFLPDQVQQEMIQEL